MISAREIRKQVSHYSLLLHERGWVANHDGNVSCRDGSNGFWITPTAVSKRECEPSSIVHCAADGKPISSGRPPSEVAMHIGAYGARSDVKAVIHAHPPYASAFALARKALGPVAMPEVVVSLGAEIPLAPLVLPKAPELADLSGQVFSEVDAALFTGNGAVTVGKDLEQAYLRMELVEHYAKIVALSQSIGGVVPLDTDAMGKMLGLRQKAGLGPQGAAHKGGAEKLAAQTAPASLGLKPIIREELKKVLGGES